MARVIVFVYVCWALTVQSPDVVLFVSAVSKNTLADEGPPMVDVVENDPS